MNLTREMHRRMIMMLVQRTITCPVGHDVLDVRTCVVIDDADGDPHSVFSRKGWADLATLAPNPLAPGYSVGKGYADR